MLVLTGSYGESAAADAIEVLTAEEDDGGNHADAEADSSGGADIVVSNAGYLRRGVGHTT